MKQWLAVKWVEGDGYDSSDSIARINYTLAETAEDAFYLNYKDETYFELDYTVATSPLIWVEGYAVPDLIYQLMWKYTGEVLDGTEVRVYDLTGGINLKIF